MTTDRDGRVRTDSVSDATVEAWLRAVQADMPGVDDPRALRALEDLCTWALPFLKTQVKRLADRYWLCQESREQLMETRWLRDTFRAFLTCRTSRESSIPAVTAYLARVDEERAMERSPRSFQDWCFWGADTRLFSYLRNVARDIIPDGDLLKTDSGVKALRRMVLDGKALEYRRSGRADDGAETWSDRRLDETPGPANAVRSGERRYLVSSDGTCPSQIVISPAQLAEERELVAQVRQHPEAVAQRFRGQSNPEVIRGAFMLVVQPRYPLLATTLRTILLATRVRRSVDPERL